MGEPSTAKRVGLCTLFFFSGITGLVYQVVWAKQLGLVLGHSADAHALVLATFMGGLAIGNHVAGPIADGSPKPLRLYGWLELGIALCGGVSPGLFSLIDVLDAVSGARGPNAEALRFATCAVALLPTTILMGATLPTLARFATRSLAQAQRMVALLYAINSGGAVIGALLAGFVLVPSLGLDGSVYVAAIVNIVIGVLALRFGKRRARLDDDAQPDGTASDAESVSVGAFRPSQVRLTNAVIFVSGFIALSYEVAWIRLLSLVLSSSAYSFSVMVAAFICGISLGGWVVARNWLPRLDSFRLLGLAELGLAAATAATLPIYERLSYDFLNLRLVLGTSSTDFYLFELAKLVVVLAVLIVPTTLLGITLPLASRVAMQSADKIATPVGRMFSLNTLGNVAGALLAGLVLMPALGIWGVIVLGIVGNALCGAAVLVHGSPSLRHRVATLAALAAISSATFFIPRWDPLVLTNGLFRSRKHLPVQSFSDFKYVIQHTRSLLFHADDRNGTVTTERMEGGNIVLRVNGKPDASSHGGDRSTQLLLAHLPLTLQPEARRVVIVGHGSGMTAGAALRHPIESLDIVEISRAVVQASHDFDHVNNTPLADPRTTLHLEDAKTFLRRSPQSYDLIISEPSNPWIAGIGTLFTVETYETALSHLAEDGLMAQWVHVYEMENESVRLILRTFCHVFPAVSVWQTSPGDVLLIAGRRPIDTSREAMTARLQLPSVADDLKRIGVTHLATLLSNQLMSDATVRAITGEGPLNRDRFPVLEYAAPKGFFVGAQATTFTDADERLGSEGSPSALLVSGLTPWGADTWAELVRFHTAFGYPRYVDQLLGSWARAFPDDARWRVAQRQRHRK